jgi:hypothetical protein
MNVFKLLISLDLCNEIVDELDVVEFIMRMEELEVIPFGMG